MASVKAYIRTKKTEGYENVRFRLSDGQKVQLYCKSGLEVEIDLWDSNKEKMKPKYNVDDNVREDFNTELSKRKEKLLTVYNTAKRAGKTDITSDWLNSELDKILYPAAVIKQTLFSYIEDFIQRSPGFKNKDKALLSPGTLAAYPSLFKHLKNFAESEGKTDYEFTKLNHLFYEKFFTFLQENCKSLKRLNSVGKQIRILKGILNKATKEEVNTCLTYQQFEVPVEKVENTFLKTHELQSIKDLDLSDKPKLARVRDGFLILAWTGCRYSDLKNVIAADIVNGTITYFQQKTNNRVVTPLHPVAMNILKKYNKQLAVQSPQTFNTAIQKIAKLAGITDTITIRRNDRGKTIMEPKQKWELVTSHTGRRSFCTNMLLDRRLTPKEIMLMSGHTSLKSFEKYLKDNPEDHLDRIREVFDTY